MYKCTQEERIFGRWVVVYDDEYIRFNHKKDADDFLKICIRNGFSAYIKHIDSDMEDDNFPYYFD